MNNVMANLYATYAERVLPVDAGEIQKIETKRAFYAGAHGMFEKMTAISSSHTEDEAMAIMQSIQDEAKQFCDNVTIGKA